MRLKGASDPDGTRASTAEGPWGIGTEWRYKGQPESYSTHRFQEPWRRLGCFSRDAGQTMDQTPSLKDSRNSLQADEMGHVLSHASRAQQLLGQNSGLFSFSASIRLPATV